MVEEQGDMGGAVWVVFYPYDRVWAWVCAVVVDEADSAFVAAADVADGYFSGGVATA